MAWPVAADLSAYLVEQGRSAPSSVALDSALASAIAAFEIGTGWIPFLGESGSNLYDPWHVMPCWDGWTLDLGSGLVSATSVYVGWDGSDGTLLTADTDYWLCPPAKVGNSQPYTGIRFAARQAGGPRSIRVTGVWGYASDIPDDVFAAILQGAAAFAITDTATVLAGKIKEGPVELDFKDGNQASAYEKAFAAAIARYRRI